jgi:hypothetical protein
MAQKKKNLFELITGIFLSCYKKVCGLFFYIFFIFLVLERTLSTER